MQPAGFRAREWAGLPCRRSCYPAVAERVATGNARRSKASVWVCIALPIAPSPVQANSDGQLIEIWLHGRSVHTQRAYAADTCVPPALEPSDAACAMKSRADRALARPIFSRFGTLAQENGL